MLPFTHVGIEVRRETLEIPTYAAGPDDPNPPLFGKGTRAIFPYTWRKSFTERIEPRTYDAIVITSRFVEATILPDWGMHLYAARDRVTGRDMFYRPAVMKPAHNAVRGAFVVGGVEFNCPVGHNAMTWSRVGVHVRKTPEGVQALFHHIDRRSGVAVAAGITLVDGYRGVRFDQYIHNPTPLPQPWYYWLNAAIAPHESLRFLFPTDVMLGHFEGAFLETVTKYPYPVREGIDYNRCMEIPEPIGLFSPGGLAGWFGAWYDDWDFGLVRWAAPWQAAGQKFWSWGNSEEGLLWGRVGADRDLPVPEIQSGRPETQMDRGILRPYAKLSHSEWWMGVSDVANVEAASRWGAMALEYAGGYDEKTRVRICPASAERQCRLRVNDLQPGGAFDLAPGKPFEIIIDLSKDEIRRAAVVSSKWAILSWSPDNAPPAATVETLYDCLEPVANMGAEGLFLRGFRCERMQRPGQAKRFYELALEKDPHFSKVHLHLGLMNLLAGDAESAVERFALALKRDRWNDEALYLHGLASLWAGDAGQARADFCRAGATRTDYALPALVQLALADLRDGDRIQAEMILRTGLEIAPANPAMLFLRSLISRKNGDAETLLRTCAELDRQLGVSLMGRWERHFAGAADSEEDSLHVPADDESEDELLIAAALRYADCGARDEALELLGKISSQVGRTKAAYLMRWIGRDAPDKARGTKFFAWGRAMRLALETSLQSTPNDSTARFALGCLLAEIGQLSSAVENLREAVKIAPDDALIRTTLGRVLLESGDAPAAASELETAVLLNPPNPAAWVHLDEALGRIGRRDSAWLKRFAVAPREVLANEDARESLARLAADVGEFDSAAGLLAATTFHPFELTHGLRNLWSEIHRLKAVRQAVEGDLPGASETIRKALEYPPNLQLGRPMRTFDAEALYAAGRIAESAGDAEGAEAYFKQAAEEDQPDPTLAKPWSVLAQKRLGDKAGAMKRLDAVQADARRYLDAAFQPDLDAALREIIALCERIRGGWVPTLDELGARR